MRNHARRCLELSQKLENDLTLDKGHFGAFGKAVKSKWTKSSVEKHKAELLGLQQAIQTQILGSSWMRDQAAQAEQQQSFNNIDDQIQHFTRKVAAGHTELADLIRRAAAATRGHTTTEGVKTRDDVTTESSKTRDHITQERTREHELQDRKQRLSKLLTSLEFQEMNARRNQRTIDAYEDTFEWIFEENANRRWDSFTSFLLSKEENLYWISDSWMRGCVAQLSGLCPSKRVSVD